MGKRRKLGDGLPQLRSQLSPAAIRNHLHKINRDEDGKIKHAIVGLMEDELFNYPFLYTLEVGGLYFFDEEAETLRTYLLRGGFLLVDDFWGEDAWNNFEFEMSKVFDPQEYPSSIFPSITKSFISSFPSTKSPRFRRSCIGPGRD